MERKTIYWNELSEQTKLVLRELSEQTKLVLPKNVKIYHSIENGCSILMFEPEKKEKVKTFLKGQILKNTYNDIVFQNTETFDTFLDEIREATLEEKDAFLFNQNKMIGENGEVVRWKPKYKQEYFTPYFGSDSNYRKFEWYDSEIDNHRYNALLVNSTGTLAIEATKKMLNSLK